MRQGSLLPLACVVTRRISTTSASKMKVSSFASLTILPWFGHAWTTGRSSLLASSSKCMQQTVACQSPWKLFSTTAPIEPSTTCRALSATGESIAEGIIFSCIKGGFVSVKLEDEIMSSAPTTPSGEKKSKSSSLGGDLLGHQVRFANDCVGIVVVHRPPIAFVYTDADDACSVDGKVQVLSSLASLDITEGMQSLDCFGRTDGMPASAGQVIGNRPIFAPIPQVKDIALINKPLVTGITMFDALSPIGKGQNMLMIGSNEKQMREYVMDILQSQKNAGNVKCIYASTADTVMTSKMVESAGLKDDVVLVNSRFADGDATASTAAEAAAVCATACSIAETYAIEEGRDCLVVVDTIDELKLLWDSTTKVLVDVFGVDAVVKGDRDGGASSEMRAFYSALIQRSAQFKEKKGGGSVTLLLMTSIPKAVTEGDEGAVFQASDFETAPAKVKDRIALLEKKGIPLTAANLRKIDIPIPSDTEGRRRLALQHVDDLISMSDGQIWLDEALEAAGRRPPMDPQRSITRVGIGADTNSRADAPAMRRVVEGLRLDLSQAASMDGADFDTKASIKQVRKFKTLLLAMHQEAGAGFRRLSDSCMLLLAANNEYLDGFVDDGISPGSQEASTLAEDLVAFVRSKAPEAVEEIDSTMDLKDQSKEAIEAAIREFVESNPAFERESSR